MRNKIDERQDEKKENKEAIVPVHILLVRSGLSANIANTF